MFNLVIELRSPSMVMIQTLGLVVDDAPGNAVCENKMAGRVDALGGSPGQRVKSLELLLVPFREIRVCTLGFGLDGVGVTLDRLDFRAGEGVLLAGGDGANSIGVALFVGVLSKSVPSNRLQA
jgi:hypothetical protein